MYALLHSFGTKSLRAPASALAQIYYSLTARGERPDCSETTPASFALDHCSKARSLCLHLHIIIITLQQKVAGGNTPKREAECEKGYFIHQVPNIQPQSSSNCEVHVKHSVHVLTNWFLFFESTLRELICGDGPEPSSQSNSIYRNYTISALFKYTVDMIIYYNPGIMWVSPHTLHPEASFIVTIDPQMFY